MNNSLINRELLNTINTVFRHFSVLTPTGPRQSGRTTSNDRFGIKDTIRGEEKLITTR